MNNFNYKSINNIIYFIFITFVIITFFSVNLYAINAKAASKVYTKIFTSIVNKDVIKVYIKNEKYLELFKYSNKLSYSINEEDSDIYIVTNSSELPINYPKIIFATDINLLKQHDNIIGAFYWDHGQPRIVFIKERLEKFNIKLDQKFKKYIKKGI